MSVTWLTYAMICKSLPKPDNSLGGLSSRASRNRLKKGEAGLKGKNFGTRCVHSSSSTAYVTENIIDNAV